MLGSRGCWILARACCWPAMNAARARSLALDFVVQLVNAMAISSGQAILNKPKKPAERLRIKSLPWPFQDLSKLAFDRFDLDSSGRLRGRCLRERRPGWLLAFRRFRCGHHGRQGFLRRDSFGRFAIRSFRGLTGDGPVCPGIQPRAIALETPHAVLCPGFQRRNDLKEVAVANEILHRM